MFTLAGKQVAKVVDDILAEQGMFLCFLLFVVDEICSLPFFERI